MAAKKTPVKRKTTKKPVERKKGTYTQAKKKTFKLTYGAMSLILFFATILTGVFIYIPNEAFVAKLIRDVFFGLLGNTAYILPAIILALGIYVIKKKNYERLEKKSILCSVILILVASLIHIISAGDLPIGEMYGYGVTGVGGGLLGGLLGLLLLTTIGKIAAIIVLVAALVAVVSATLRISLLEMISSFFGGLFTKKEKGKKRVKEEEYEDYEEEEIPHGRRVRGRNKLGVTGKNLDFDIDEKKKDQNKADAFTQAIESVIFDSQEEKKEQTAQQAEKAEPITKEERDKVHSEINKGVEQEYKNYKFPPINLLKAVPGTSADKRQEMRETAQKLMEVLSDFNVEAKLLQVTPGPSVTRYEIQPETGVKLAKITSLAEDIAWKLAVPTVLVAAVPGKAAVGIEVPNNSIATVSAREIIENSKFKEAESKIAVGFGKDIGGSVVVGDIAKMPHVLIAGATGSGKSVCINTIITSILYKAKPDEVKLIMVDPKVVELGVYNGIPHLLIPVVTDPKRAAGALNWAVQEMMKRYDMFAQTHVRNLEGYNKLQQKNGEPTMPKIVIIIDELADLMMVAAKEVEDSICRLAQLARAAGIHLIVATQRPSVDVITGLIKANVPSRIAFAVSSQVDSRTILDRGGAEKLLGKGDMLYYPAGVNTPMRVQGAYVSDNEIEKVVEFVKSNCEATHYSEDLQEHIDRVSSGENGVTDENDADDADALLPQAIELAVELGQISTAMIQRRLKVGYSRAGRIIDQMEQRGIISGPNGSKPRDVYTNRISFDDFRDDEE